MFWIRLWALLALLAGARQQPFDARVAVPPAVVNVGGQPHLVYELQLVSQSAVATRLQSVDVVHARTARLIARQDPHVIMKPGEFRVLYFWAPVDEAPDTIEHRITVMSARDTLRQIVRGVATASPKQRAVLGPPLRGGPWVAVYDPLLERGHRRVLFEMETGQRHIPARFAIDWMRVNERGQLARGADDLVRNHFSYGEDVLAVANARVADVRDGIHERTRRVHIAHGPKLASGNYITLDLGHGRFVSYEHLQTGSVSVQPGDSVQRGQVIARVGFSGDGSHPHLHMHVSDGATPVTGEGMPWTLAEYRQIGRYADLRALFAGQPWHVSDPMGERRDELPAPYAVVLFPLPGASEH